MAINKAMYNGVQSIMDAYDRNSETPYYSVWAGRDMVFSYNDDDIEKGRNHLLENLVACEQNEHTDILKIKFHPKKEKTFITDRTPAIATLFVRVCDVNQNRGQIMPMQQNYNQNPQLIQMLEKQNELISGINNRLALIEEEPELEDNESETEAVIGRIETLLNHPVLNLVLGLVAPKISEFMKPQNNMVTALAGVENTDNKSDENLLIEALDLLSKKVENLPLTLHKLAIYAEKNPSQFNMLVSML